MNQTITEILAFGLVPTRRKVDLLHGERCFSSSILFGHNSGYRLPSFEQFFKYCEQTFANKHPDREHLTKYFSGELSPGMRQHVGVWYESGMAETYLYACLVDMQVVNGSRLFSVDAVDTLLQQLYEHAGVVNGSPSSAVKTMCRQARRLTNVRPGRQ